MALHLIALHLSLERTVPSEVIIRTLRSGSTASGPPRDITVADVVGATQPEDHQRLVRDWAASAWEAWRPHHPTVHAWAKDLLDGGANPEGS